MAEQAGHPAQHKHPTLWEKPLSPLTAAEETTGHCLSVSHDLSTTLSFCSLTFFHLVYILVPLPVLFCCSSFLPFCSFPLSMSTFSSLSEFASPFCYCLSVGATEVEHQSFICGVFWVRFSKLIAGWSLSRAYALNLSNISTHYQLKIRIDALCLVAASFHD